MRSFSGSHSARYLHISASVPPDKTDVRDVHSRTHSPRMHTMGSQCWRQKSEALGDGPSMPRPMGSPAASSPPVAPNDPL